MTSIGATAFAYCNGLTSVTIPNSVRTIGSGAFGECHGLISLSIGSGVNMIGEQAFANCKELTDVYCWAEKVATMNGSSTVTNENVLKVESDIFQNSYIEYATLHVPVASINNYKTVEPWKNFKEIVALNGETPEVKKCATPTIAFVDGKLKFSCETEGVEYVSEVTSKETKKYYSDEVDKDGTYTVTVYATKTGWENSDVATLEFSLGGGGVPCDVNGDGKVDVSDYIGVANYILTGSIYGNGSMTRAAGSRRR